MTTKDQTAFKYQLARRKRTGEYRTCLQCKKVFYLVPARVKRDEKFCSRKCQHVFLSIEKICPICNNAFKVLKSVANRYTVCSWECRSHLLHDETCERCGKTFKTNETRWKRRFCSEECRRPPVTTFCKVCGKEFRHVPSSDRQFCSFSCYRRFTGENALEKSVRLSLEEMHEEYVQEARIGRYSIDFFLPKYGIALEIDGAYWHRDAKRDERKNKYLANYGLKVIRISDEDIYKWGANDAIHNHINLITK